MFSVAATCVTIVVLSVLFRVVDPRQIRRICKDSEIEILSVQGVRVEPVERSHVELLLAENMGDNKFSIRFEFKTTEANGILFYGRRQENPKELIALRLFNGDLYYKIQCSSLSADVLIPTKFRTRLDDGRWHAISLKFKKNGMKAHIEVDGIKDSKTYDVSCEDMTSLVFGGISPRDKEFVVGMLGHMAHFDGCIRRVHLPTALRTTPKYYAVSVCD